MKKALAIDIGGTKIYSAIISENGEFLSEIEKHSTPKNFNDIKSLLQKIIITHAGEFDVVSFATAGTVNNENTNVIGSTGNLPKEYPTLDFQSLSDKMVFVENDANSAAWAEYAIGSAKNCPNSIILTLGTGVGGGIILNGELYKGKSGAAGEMHFKMYSDKRRKCTCGSWDCFEAYASGTGLKRTAEEMTNDKSITTYDVIDGVKNNNKIMLEIFNTWQNHILLGLIGIANLFDPDCIVLSGSMAQFVDTNYLENNTNKEIVTQPTKIRIATAGNNSGMIGCAMLAFKKLNKQGV